MLMFWDALWEAARRRHDKKPNVFSLFFLKNHRIQKHNLKLSFFKNKINNEKWDILQVKI